MPALTRRRYPERQDCWHIYFGDVHVGTIARRIGQPYDQEAWQWLCGFYPGSNPDEQRSGTAVTFDQARADFEVAWQVFSARRSPADYQAWRDQRDWTARKYDVGARRAAPVSRGHPVKYATSRPSPIQVGPMMVAPAPKPARMGTG